MKVIAHRGNSGYFKENSFESILSAMHERVDMVEIDLRQTKDGKIIVFHDDNLKRIFNQSGVVSSMTYDELAAACEGEVKILTLKEVVKLVKGRAKVLFEIKDTCDELDVYEQLKSLDYSDYIIQSFDIQKLEKLRDLDRKLNLCFITLLSRNVDVDQLLGLNIRYVNISDSFLLKKSFVENLIEHDINCFVWTVNTEKKFAKYISYGVSGIVTDYPFELIDYINHLNCFDDKLKSASVGRIGKLKKKISKAIKRN